MPEFFIHGQSNTEGKTTAGQVTPAFSKFQRLKPAKVEMVKKQP